MSLGPDREPITRPVFVWLEVAAQLAGHGETALAAAIRQAMDGRRLGENGTFIPHFCLGCYDEVCGVMRRPLSNSQKIRTTSPTKVNAATLTS